MSRYALWSSRNLFYFCRQLVQDQLIDFEFGACLIYVNTHKISIYVIIQNNPF